MPLPDVGGNLLLPVHAEHPDGGSSSSIGMLNPYYNCCCTAPSCSCASTNTGGPGMLNGSAAAAAELGALHQLRYVSSEALTFALLGVWGAAPKMMCLISTVGGAAAAAARNAKQQRGHQQGAGKALRLLVVLQGLT
jgi:hypothetical protein